MEVSQAPMIPDFLSQVPEKRVLYATDTYFQEGLEDLVTVTGGRIKKFCYDHALLLLKPDAAVTRRVNSVLRWITEYGFVIVGFARVTMNRHAIRALWQYGLNAASRDRRDAADLYVTAGDCMLVLLSLANQAEPATTVLSRAKGPADPADCRRGQLRHEIGSFNYQLNLVHTADEPADFVRELSVLCDYETRIRLIRQAFSGADASAEVHDFASEIENAVPEEDLDFSHNIAALAADLERSKSPVTSHLHAELACQLENVRAGRSRDWRQVLRLADRCAVPVSTWRRIVIATNLLEPHVPGMASMLPDASSAYEQHES